MLRTLSLLLVCTFYFAAVCAAAGEAPHITDNGNVFSREATRRAEARLDALEKKSGIHVHVVGMQSLNGGEASSQAAAAYESGGYGSAGGRSLVFVLAKDDRSAAVHPSSAAELPEGLSQASAAQLIGGRIMPNVLLGDMDAALDSTVAGSEQTIGGATSFTGVVVMAVIALTIALAAVLASLSLVTVIPFALAVLSAACWFMFPDQRMIAAGTVLVLLAVAAAVARWLFRSSEPIEIVGEQPDKQTLTPSSVWNWQMNRGVTFEKRGVDTLDNIDQAKFVAPVMKPEKNENERD